MREVRIGSVLILSPSSAREGLRWRVSSSLRRGFVAPTAALEVRDDVGVGSAGRAPRVLLSLGRIEVGPKAADAFCRLFRDMRQLVLIFSSFLDGRTH